MRPLAPKNIHDMYDQHTTLIMHMVLGKDSNCVDVGAHVGHILTDVLEISPKGRHYAFEPIPYLYAGLKANPSFDTVEIHDCALSDETGETTFFLVENAPAYSGMKQRRYDSDNPQIKEITVRKRRLDDIVSADQCIDLIKIDVEGAEMLVMRGAQRIICDHKPYIIFESGLGASDRYGEDGDSIFAFLVDTCGLELNTLDGYLCGSAPLSKDALRDIFNTTSRYYFVAHKPLSADERAQIFRNYVLHVDSQLFDARTMATRLATLERALADLPDIAVDDWGAKETAQGEGVNVQPDGSSALWVRARNVTRLHDVHVYFNDIRAQHRASVSDSLLTTDVPAPVIATPGDYEVVIAEAGGRRATVGTFVVREPVTDDAPTAADDDTPLASDDTPVQTPSPDAESPRAL